MDSTSPRTREEVESICRDISLQSLTQRKHLPHLVLVSYSRFTKQRFTKPKEDVMKAYMIVYVAIVAATLTMGAQAQPNESPERAYFPDVLTIQSANYALLEKKYADCLNSENDGVVESALAHVAMFKLMYPVKELATLKRAVEQVAARHDSKEIRYKAYLVSSLYENPKQFVNEARTSYANPDELFGALASRMNETIVSRMEK